MKIHTNCQQGSIEWLMLRAGKVTASEMDRIVTPLGKIRTGEGPRTFMLEKLSERWLGAPLPNEASTFAMEQGQILEEYARPAFELETGLKIKQVAFVETDDGFCGCSPDGIVEGQDIGLEIKSPGIVNHLRYLLDGILPFDYVLQVQGSMFVTGWSKWMFTSFRRGMPPLILTVIRDDKIQAAIASSVSLLREELNANWTMLCHLNGGPPPPPRKFTPTPGPVKFSWEQSTDLIP